MDMMNRDLQHMIGALSARLETTSALVDFWGGSQ